MKLFLIRHGMTKGNIEKRYIGSTDEILCPEGIEQLEQRKRIGIYKEIPEDAILWSSPMRRCLQTAEILFGKKQPKIENRLRECDFGDWEGKNYIDLSNDKNYQAWIDSGGSIPFPNGEAIQTFKRRCVQACCEILNQGQESDHYIFVVHGGTIMAILEQLGYPKKGYYDYQCQNGEGYVCTVERNRTITLQVQRCLQDGL